jgi:hypothetical protein
MKWVVPAMRQRSTRWSPTVLLLAAAVAFLTPLACASPTDPTWIVGMYDAGDSDDVILLVDSTLSTPADWSECAVPLTLAPENLNPAARASVDVDRPPLAFEGRGPPPA